MPAAARQGDSESVCWVPIRDWNSNLYVVLVGYKSSLLGAYKGLKHTFLKEEITRQVGCLLGAYKGLKLSYLFASFKAVSCLLGAYKGLKLERNFLGEAIID